MTMRNTGRVETTTRQRNALLEAMPFGATAFEVTNTDDRTPGDGRRQCSRKDESGCKAAYEIAESGGAGNVSSDHAERFRQCAFDHRQSAGHTVPLGDPAAARAIDPDRMH